MYLFFQEDSLVTVFKRKQAPPNVKKKKKKNHRREGVSAVRDVKGIRGLSQHMAQRMSPSATLMLP